MMFPHLGQIIDSYFMIYRYFRADTITICIIYRSGSCCSKHMYLIRGSVGA